MREVFGWICLITIATPVVLLIAYLQWWALWRGLLVHLSIIPKRYRSKGYEESDEGPFVILFIEAIALLIWGATWGLDGVFR